MMGEDIPFATAAIGVAWHILQVRRSERGIRLLHYARHAETIHHLRQAARVTLNIMPIVMAKKRFVAYREECFDP